MLYCKSTPNSGLARHSMRCPITPNGFHSSLTSQTCDTVNSNLLGFRQPEVWDSWSFPLHFPAFLLVALAFMSMESSCLISGVMRKSFMPGPNYSSGLDRHNKRRQRKLIFYTESSFALFSQVVWTMWGVLRRGPQMGDCQANTHTTLDLFAPPPKKSQSPLIMWALWKNVKVAPKVIDKGKIPPIQSLLAQGRV